jgi:hypothetical protein
MSPHRQPRWYEFIPLNEYRQHGRPYWYRIIPDDQVCPPEFPPIARAIAVWACRDLQMDAIEIRWFVDTPGFLPYAELKNEADQATFYRNLLAPDDITGRFILKTPDTIYVRVVPSPMFVAHLVLHEARHVWRYRREVARGTLAEYLQLAGNEKLSAQADKDAETYARRSLPKVCHLLERYEDRRRLGDPL